MPSSYTTSLRLTLPATGENSGTWGTLVNTGITELTDAAIAGYVSIAMTDADYTLTVANGLTDQARRMMLNMTGTLTAARNVICPTASKLYIIKNATTGGFAITLKTSAGTGISIPNGSSMLLMCNGTDVVDAVTNFSSLTLGSPLLPASGGTGITSLGTGVATFLGTPSSANLAAAVTDETGSGALVFGTSPTLASPTITGTGTAAFGNLSYTGTLTGGTGVVALGTNQFYKDASGNVGIGTASPGAKLDVVGTAAISGAVTLSGGTANGVLYLNGSKVATSGSALTFDGTGIERIVATNGAYQVYKDATPSIAARWALNTGFANAAEMSVYNGTSWAHSFTVDSTGYASWVLGGAEQMRLTSTGLGIGTASPAYKLDVSVGTNTIAQQWQGASAGAGFTLRLKSGNGASPSVSVYRLYMDYLNGTNTNGYLDFYRGGAGNDGYLVFGTAGSDRMTLDASGNLGLGVTTAVEKLTVWAGNAYVLRNGGAKLRLADQLNEVSFESVPVGSSSDAIWKTSSLERMRLDQNGNLGLGVTPSAWSSSAKAFQFNTRSAIFGFSDDTHVAQNVYYDSVGYKYIATTGAASNYRQTAGQHQWYTAPSGTAGNAISFTQAMTLDASGRLGVGVTNPSQKLHVSGTAANTQILVTETTGYGLFASANTGGNTYFGIDTSAGAVTGTAYATMVWRNEANPIVFGTTNTERMRLDSSGNLGLGVAPSAWSGAITRGFDVLNNFAISAGGSLYGVSNAYYNGTNWIYKNTAAATYSIQTAGQHQFFTAPSGTAGNAISFTQAMTLDASGNLTVGNVKLETGSGFGGINTVGATPLLFYTNATEKARITSGGDFLVGTTATLSSGRMRVNQPGGASQGVVDLNHDAASGTRYLAVFYVQGVEKGSIVSDGSTVAYNTSSDLRLKENIAPAADAGAVLDAIDVVQHDWKAGGHTRYGVIAQDLQAVAPEAVSAGDDGDEIERTWGVDYSKLVPMLIKEIQSLRARVASLETQP